MAADFTIFGVFGFVGFVASVLLLRWMRTTILAGGIAVVRSGSCSVFGLPKMVNGYVFCSTATGLLGRTALGAKKEGTLCEIVRKATRKGGKISWTRSVINVTF